MGIYTYDAHPFLEMGFSCDKTKEVNCSQPLYGCLGIIPASKCIKGSFMLVQLNEPTFLYGYPFVPCGSTKSHGTLSAFPKDDSDTILYWETEENKYIGIEYGSNGPERIVSIEYLGQNGCCTSNDGVNFKQLISH